MRHGKSPVIPISIVAIISVISIIGIALYASALTSSTTTSSSSSSHQTTTTSFFETTSVQDSQFTSTGTDQCAQLCTGTIAEESCYIGCQVNFNVLIILQAQNQGAIITCTSGTTSYGANICSTGPTGTATFQVTPNAGPIAACIYSTTTGTCIVSWSQCFSNSSAENCVSINVANQEPLSMVIYETPALSFFGLSGGPLSLISFGFVILALAIVAGVLFVRRRRRL
ncbi:MAG: hypothetical protein ACYCQJ_12965 [Nitrososphaerales archaeon]